MNINYQLRKETKMTIEELRTKLEDIIDPTLGITLKESDGIKHLGYDKEKDVVKNQKIENFKMTNTSLKYDGGYSTLETDVKNISNETNYLKSFDIIVKDKSGKEMIKLVGYIGEEISAGETKKIISKTDMDLSKAGSVEYTINR